MFSMKHQALSLDFFHESSRIKAVNNKKCWTTHMQPFSSPWHTLLHNFVIENCHKWVHESVQSCKKKNNEDFVINSFQDNETFKAPVT
jgi:hypothetical protein